MIRPADQFHRFMHRQAVHVADGVPAAFDLLEHTLSLCRSSKYRQFFPLQALETAIGCQNHHRLLIKDVYGSNFVIRHKRKTPDPFGFQPGLRNLLHLILQAQALDGHQTEAVLRTPGYDYRVQPVQVSQFHGHRQTARFEGSEIRNIRAFDLAVG